MKTNHSVLKSFGYALNGIKESIKAEPNLRVHFVAGFFAIVLGIFLKLNEIEWAILLIVISLVFVTEFLNTVLENIVDLVSPEIHDKAKIAKDVSAASVLIVSILSLLVGAIIFLPKISTLIH